MASKEHNGWCGRPACSECERARSIRWLREYLGMKEPTDGE